MGGERDKRYDPASTMDSWGFVNQWPKGENTVAAQTALASIFTPLVELAHQKIVENPGGLIIPEELSGSEPAVSDSTRGTISQKNYIEFYNPSFAFLNPVKATSHVRSDNHSPSQAQMPTGIFNIVMPVGRYGEVETIALVQAVRAAFTTVPEAVSTEAEKAHDAHENLLKKATMMSNPLSTILDSLNSTAEAFTFLSGNSEVPGYENDPVGLFRRFIENGTFSRLARLLDLGDLGQINLNLLIPTDIIDPETVTLRSGIAKQLSERLKQRNPLINSETISHTGKGCPVAYHNAAALNPDGSVRKIEDTGVDIAAKILVEYFAYFYNASSANGKNTAIPS